MRFSSKTRQHKKEPIVDISARKSHNQLLAVKYRCFLALLVRSLLVRFVCRASFQTYVLRYLMIAPMGPQNLETTESMWRSKEVCIPPPVPKILSSLILNLVLSRTVRKCFKKMSRACIWHANWTTTKKGKGLCL